MSPSNLASVLKYRQSENIIITSELEKWHLDGLFDRTIDAARVPGYFSQQVAHDIANKIKRSVFFGNYVNAPKIGRIGQAFFECQNDEVSLSHYCEFANIWIKEMRKEVSPFLSPIDRLRLELSEVWPSHCNLAEIGGHKLFAGLVREFKVGSYAKSHTAGHLISHIIEEMDNNLSPAKGHHYPDDSYIELIENERTNDNFSVELINEQINLLVNRAPRAIQSIDLDLAEVQSLRPLLCKFIPQSTHIRMIVIDGFTPVPCGGTHVVSTSELNGLHVTRIKRKKDRIKVSYSIHGG